jgi:hypothetical protein
MSSWNSEMRADSCQLLDLAFLTDPTLKLNVLNLELQGKHKHIAETITSVTAFRAILTLWITIMKDSTSFSTSKEHVGSW